MSIICSIPSTHTPLLCPAAATASRRGRVRKHQKVVLAEVGQIDFAFQHQARLEHFLCKHVLAGAHVLEHPLGRVAPNLLGDLFCAGVGRDKREDEIQIPRGKVG